MKIDDLYCSEETEWHIWARHRISLAEVEQAADQFEWASRGRSPGIYELYGRSEAGRFLIIIVRYEGRAIANVVTARDMTRAERRRHAKQTMH